MPDDIGATERTVREWQERATKKAERFGRMQSRIERISVRRSPVTARSGSCGMLENLVLRSAREIGRYPSAPVRSCALVHLTRKIPERMQYAVADTVGVDEIAVQHVPTSMTGRTVPRTARIARRGARTAGRDDHLSSGPFLRVPQPGAKPPSS